eukprot:scaffold24521_cov38-Cyclotella_meneghiniana.AAC.1
MSFSSFVKFTGPEARGPGKGVPFVQQATGHPVTSRKFRAIMIMCECEDNKYDISIESSIK